MLLNGMIDIYRSRPFEDEDKKHESARISIFNKFRLTHIAGIK